MFICNSIVCTTSASEIYSLSIETLVSDQYNCQCDRGPERGLFESAASCLTAGLKDCKGVMRLSTAYNE